MSLNYRDAAIAQSIYPSGNRGDCVPCSDGAGTIVAIGGKVTRWQVGDRVCSLFNQQHLYGPLTNDARKTGLGNSVDGCLREYGKFGENGLVSPASSSCIASVEHPCTFQINLPALEDGKIVQVGPK